MTLGLEISKNKNILKPVIYGIAGTMISDEEKRFFSKASPIGFILFSRNIKDKNQLKKLTDSLRDLMGGEVLILIDQEGGRVARMKPPVWDDYKSGKYFADLYLSDQNHARQELFDSFSKIADDLIEVGINTNCAPILDVLTPNTHQVISDRAYGNDPARVTDLANQVCKALQSKNLFPIIKHIPGHGRAICDSHLDLPVISDDLASLERSDFLPFASLKDQKLAMTAHIVFECLDLERPVTTSKKAIDYIRNQIGFKNILMSDDLSMKALKGDFINRTKDTLAAGCDLVLHCNGKMDEMLAIDSVASRIQDNFWERFLGN